MTFAKAELMAKRAAIQTSTFAAVLGDRIRSVGRQRLARNVAANYLGSSISASVPILALPFLVEALGRTYWGLISFATFMITLMSVFNAGVTQSLVKAFGSRWAEGVEGRMAAARLLYSLERYYWCGALIIAVAVAPFSDFIVSRWLNVKEIPHDVAIGAIYCAIALFLIQLPAALYGAVLTALQEQVSQNTIRGSYALFKGVGGVVVAITTHSALAYLTFLISAFMLETLTVAWIAWRSMPRSRSHLLWDAGEIRDVLPFSVRMSALVMLGALTTQIDKFYVSLKLPIEEFGVYSIAYSVAIGLLQFSYPVLTATLPRLVEIGADHSIRRRMTLQLMKLIGAIVLVIGVGYILCGRLILELWLGDPALAVNVSVVLNWLMLSSAMNVVYNVGYINWVSLGETRWIAIINSASFVIALIVTPFCIRAFGLPGAAFSMVTINLIGCVSAMIWFAQGFSRQKRAIR